MQARAKGILAGVSTGAFWGLPFLVPQILPSNQYSSLDITIGRFGFFALASLAMIFLRRQSFQKLLRQLSWQELPRLILMSCAGFSVYSWVLFLAVQNAGGAIPAVIIGLLPVTISGFGSGWVQLSAKFWLGLLLIVGGLLFLTRLQSAQEFENFWLGVVLSVVCLAFWTWYSVTNTRFLQTHPGLDEKDFSSLMGVLCLLGLLVILSFHQSSMFTNTSRFLEFRYLCLSALLGVGASWLANWLWNICSSLCPPNVSGPLIVFETIFGLLYTFIWLKSWPQLYELAALMLFFAGVFICLKNSAAVLPAATSAP